MKMQLQPPADQPRLREYVHFTRARANVFVRKGGRLFSDLERQRLIYSIIEAEHEAGGANLDLDELVATRVRTRTLHRMEPSRSLLSPVLRCCSITLRCTMSTSATRSMRSGYRCGLGPAATAA